MTARFWTNKDFWYRIANIIVAAILLTLGIITLVNQYRDFKAAVIGIYSTVFGATILVAELGVQIIVTTYCSFLNNLFGRGLFYILIGVLMLNPEVVWMMTLAVIVIAIGFLYLFLHCIPSARPTKLQRRVEI
jgi:hypothetical protein